MATTYNADNYGVPMPSCPFVGVVLRRDFLFTVAVALVINDVIQCCKIPGAGAPLILDNFFIDCADLEEALGVARDLGKANPGGAYEVRPLRLFVPGTLPKDASA